MRLPLFLAALGAALPSAAQNLVANPGFEAGSTLVGYAVTGNPNIVSVTTNHLVLVAHSGLNACYLAPAGSPGGIAQTLATVPGTAYDVGFYVRSGGGLSDPNNAFTASFGSGSLALGDLPLVYARYSFTVVAASTSTTLGFSARKDTGSYLLDDISVSPVPEPSALLLLGLPALALLRRRPRPRVPGVDGAFRAGSGAFRAGTDSSLPRERAFEPHDAAS